MYFFLFFKFSNSNIFDIIFRSLEMFTTKNLGFFLYHIVYTFVQLSSLLKKENDQSKGRGFQKCRFNSFFRDCRRSFIDLHVHTKELSSVTQTNKKKQVHPISVYFFKFKKLDIENSFLIPQTLAIKICKINT